jgi:hypothetical protein
MNSLKTLKIATGILIIFLLVGAVLEAGAGQRRRRYNPEAGKAKAAKRIGVGTAIGAAAGALINGKKGALIGAGAGAAGGTVYHYHKKRQGRRRRY